MCHQVLADDRSNAMWGLHTLRKTGYLLAIWADAPIQEVMQSARHSTSKNSVKYSRDAATLREVAKTNGTLMQLTWRSAFILDRQSARSLNRSRLNVPEELTSVSALSKTYVEIFLKISKPQTVTGPTDPILGVHTAVKAALTFRTPDTEKDRLFAFVRNANLPETDKQLFHSLLTSFLVTVRTTRPVQSGLANPSPSPQDSSTVQ